MKLKITRKAVIVAMLLIGIALLFTTFWMFSDSSKMFNDTVYEGYRGMEVNYGWIHMALNTFLVLTIIVWLICLLWEILNDAGDRAFEWLYGDNEIDFKKKISDDEKVPFKWNWRKIIKYGILIIVLFYSFKLIKAIYKDNVFLYNTSKKYHNTYQQKVEEKQGYYDKLWKTYLQKEKITNINKETFILVTEIIMENRADGENVTWKWLQENQRIPYEQFTVFYADLSDFITSQREGYFSIEKQCQLIANQNNTLLDTFPNNIYNRMLKLEKIEFKYGFLSDSTENVFRTGKENIK